MNFNGFFSNEFSISVEFLAHRVRCGVKTFILKIHQISWSKQRYIQSRNCLVMNEGIL